METFALLMALSDEDPVRAALLPNIGQSQPAKTSAPTTPSVARTSRFLDEPRHPTLDPRFRVD